MAIGTLFGSSTESSGLYGIATGSAVNPTVVSQTYFEWFIFITSAGTPATPTGGSWNFTSNIGVPPTGWSNFISGVPLNSLWFSVAFVDSRNPLAITWSTPGLISSQSVYATAYADVFTGNGSTTAWTLTQDPVVVNNTDVSINGVTQRPTTDYTLSGTTLTTTTAAPLNSVILVKYRQALPLSYYGAASNVQFTPVGTLSSTNVQAAIAEVLTDYALQTGAASIGFTPVGALASTNVQAAIAEVVTDLALSSGSSTVGYTQGGTGAVATTVQAKLQSYVSVYDFMTAAQIADSKTVASTLDMTAAFTAAQAASKFIYIPPGFYTLNNFIHKTGVVFKGSGLRSTYILQGATGNPAWWCVSSYANNPYQNTGCELSGVWFLGKSSATVAMCIVEAASPFIVSYSIFDIGGSDGYRTFEVKCPIGEVFANKISVVQERHASPIGSFGVTGSYNTGVVLNAGSYNDYYLNIAQCSNGKAVACNGSWNIFNHLGTEGQVVITGQDNTIVWALSEGWTTGAPACDFVYDIQGTGNQFIDGPDILVIPQSKVTGAAMQGPIDGTLVVNNLRIVGSAASLTLTGTLTAATSATLTTAWTQDGTGVYKVDFLNSAIAFGAPLVAATTGTLTANWTAASGTARVTFSDGSIQDCLFTNGSAVVNWIKPVTATAVFTVKMTRAVSFTNGSTAISWTGAVTCGTFISAIYSVPTAGMYLRSGSSGSITNADTTACAYTLETMPSGSVYTFPSAETLSNFTFQGNCVGLTNKGAYWNDGGTITFLASTTYAVLLTKPQPNASYRVALAPEANKTFWVTNKTQIGFTINASSASSDVVDWTVTR